MRFKKRRCTGFMHKSDQTLKIQNHNSCICMLKQAFLHNSSALHVLPQKPYVYLSLSLPIFDRGMKFALFCSPDMYSCLFNKAMFAQCFVLTIDRSVFTMLYSMVVLIFSYSIVNVLPVTHVQYVA